MDDGCDECCDACLFSHGFPLLRVAALLQCLVLSSEFAAICYWSL